MKSSRKSTMKLLFVLPLAAIAFLAFGGSDVQAGHGYVRRQGYQQYHYSPYSYRSRDRVIYRHGYSGPSRGYYRYGDRHYGQRSLYFNFFGLPIVTY